jgi:hypothetical protein
MGFQKVRVCLEELSDQSLEGNAVYIRVWVEKFEIYLDTALLNNNQRMISSKDNKKSNRLCVATPFVVVIVALSSLWHCSKYYTKEIEMDRWSRVPSRLVRSAGSTGRSRLSRYPDIG